MSHKDEQVLQGGKHRVSARIVEIFILRVIKII